MCAVGITPSGGNAEKLRSGKNKLVLTVCLLLNLGILFFFKYYNFAFTNLALILKRAGISFSYPKFDLLLPVGISFYTFQALGYMIDVYRGDIKAEKNILKYALFVSFFPQLVAGPIERSKNLLEQIEKPTVFDVENARQGLLTMAYGFFVKVVLADNIANVINPIFKDINKYHSMAVAAAVVLFAFQIYCDFHGYTQIAIGSARVLGYKLSDNFKSPYLSKDTKEFWRSWHISLTSWFTDYVYIPLGGNRKGTFRKYVNTMIVFLISGLWHGASWSFVVWGGLNGLYLVCHDVFKGFRSGMTERLRINTETKFWNVFRVILTFLLVDYAWIYFLADGLKQAVRIQLHILKNFHLQYFFGTEFWEIFGTHTSLLTILFSIIIVMIIDYMEKKNIDWKQRILYQQMLVRWLIYLTIIFVIMAFGVWGIENGQTQFIYFQF